MAEEHSEGEATLKLTVVRAEGLKDLRFLGRMKTFVVAWIDPRLKRSTKTLNSPDTNPAWIQELSFPLSHQTLQNPNSGITIQVLSPSSPIHREKVIGSTVLTLSQIRYDEEVFTLQLWRPSGRAYGLLRVSARIEYNVGGFYSPIGCVTGIPVERNTVPLVLDQSAPVESDFVHAVPSAPPIEDRVNVRRSFLIGLLSGAVAAVLIGSTVN